MATSEKIAVPELAPPEALRQSLPALQPGCGIGADVLANYSAFFSLDFETRIDGLSHDLGYFSSDNFAIATHIYHRESDTATAVILHGLFDHAGLFGHVIGYCLQRGWSVVVFDLPGHGLSSGKPAEIRDFTQYNKALSDALAQIPLFNLPARLIGFGQSTGGGVLMTHLLNHPQDFADTILMAPLVRPMGWRWTFPVLGMLHLFTENIARKFAQSSTDANFLVFLRHRDPLQPRHLPVQWLQAMKRWSLSFETLPPSPQQALLILQGGQDWTVDWRYNVAAVQRLFPAAELRIFDFARHHLANESESLRDKLWQAIDAYHGVSR